LIKIAITTIMPLIIVVKIISSYSLCWMLYFQILYCRDVCLELPESPKFMMFCKRRSLIDFKLKASVSSSD